MVTIPNIDAIVELVLREARSRPRQDMIFHIYNVTMEIQLSLMEIMDNLADEERRDKDVK